MVPKTNSYSYSVRPQIAFTSRVHILLTILSLCLFLSTCTKLRKIYQKVGAPHGRSEICILSEFKSLFLFRRQNFSILKRVLRPPEGRLPRLPSRGFPLTHSRIKFLSKPLDVHCMYIIYELSIEIRFLQEIEHCAKLFQR